MKNNLKNSVYGILGFIFPLAITLVTTPYIIHKLTPEIYGIYILSTSLMGLMSFLDLGFGQGIIKFVSHYEAIGDYKKINKIISTSLFIYSVMGFLASCIIFFLSDFLVVNIFKISPSKISIGSAAFKIVAFGFFVNFVSGLFSSIPKGLQRYDIAVKIQNPILFIYIMVTISLLYLGEGLVEILMAYSIIQLIGLIIYIYIAKKILPKFRLGFGFDIPVFREIIGFSVFVSLNVITGNIVSRIDKMIVSYFLGTNAVSFYTIPYNLASAVSSLVGSANQFLFPAISELNSKGDHQQVRDYFIKSLDYTAFISTSLMIIFIIFSDSFISVWLGRDFAANSRKIAPFFGFTFFFSCLSSVSLWFYTALNKTHINLISSLSGSLLYFAASLFLIPLLNIKGAAISFMFILIPFPIYNLYISRLIGISVNAYFIKIIPHIVIIVISLLYVIFYNKKELSVNILVCLALLLIIFITKKRVLLNLINKIFSLRGNFA